jgi:Major Facilitator Superfamily
MGVESERLPSGIRKIVAVAAIGSFMAQIDATVVNVSLASLGADLHVSLSTIQWVTSGYLLALALMLPLNGWLVDRIGAKALYLWCFAAFTLSSLLCGLAGSAPPKGYPLRRCDGQLYCRSRTRPGQSQRRRCAQGQPQRAAPRLPQRERSRAAAPAQVRLPPDRGNRQVHRRHAGSGHQSRRA